MLALLTPTRAARTAPVVAAPYLTSATGVTDRDAPTVDQLRTSYRGLTATLARLRAGAVAAAMQSAEAVREVGPHEFAPVGPGEPWARLLRQPHPSYSPLYLWHWVQQAKDLGRGAFLVVGRDSRGVPTALYPVHPVFGSMSPVGGPLGQVAGYVFVRSDGTRTPYAARDVVWIRHPHPASPYDSASILEISAYESDTDLYAHVYRRDLMRRGGAPKLQLTTDQVLDQVQANLAEERATSKVLGRADRIPVFGKGMELKPVGLSAQDMEYVKAAELTRTELYEIWGVPQGLRDMDATRANAEQAARSFAQWTVQPEVNDLADQLTTQLRAAFAPEGAPPVSALAVHAPDVVPLDPDFLLRRDEVFLRTGRLTPNEIREADGRDGFGVAGDAPLVSAALVPLGSLHTPAPPPPPPTPPTVVPDDEEGPDDEPDDEADEVDRLTLMSGISTRSERLFGALRQRAVALTDADLDLEWRAVDRTKRRAERPVEAAALDYLRAMRADVLAKLRALPRSHGEGTSPKRAEVSAAFLFDVDEWTRRVGEDLGPAFVRAMAAGFASGAFRLDVELSYDAARPAVRQALAEIVGKAQSVPATMRDALSSEIATGLSAGDDVDALASRVEALFESMEAWKARQIAQTSGTAAFESGQVQSYKAAGVESKRWLSQRDGRVRPEHDALDGEEVPVDGLFSNGDPYPISVNCRCSTLPILGTDGDDDGPRSAPVADLSTPDGRRNALIRERYDALCAKHGRGVALQTLADDVADRAEAEGWSVIGTRQVLRIAKGHGS